MVADQHARKRVPSPLDRRHVSVDQILVAVAVLGIVVAVAVALWSGA
ncbi:MAG: hypothetical protein JO222_08810 [Frankiales bacterium]|nr:hypothetical protein [Frankiales bacterium]